MWSKAFDPNIIILFNIAEIVLRHFKTAVCSHGMEHLPDSVIQRGSLMEETYTKQDEIRIIPTTGRNNCGGRCIIYAHVRDGKIEKLSTETKGTKEHPVPLCACARGLNYHKTFLGNDRLLWPMKRVGERGEEKFERISWEDAVDLLAREYIRIRDTYGPGALYVNDSCGVSALLRGDHMIRRLMALDKGYLDSYNSYSSACIRNASEITYGTGETGNYPSDWVNSKLIILWGHNPAETHFDSCTMFYLKKAKSLGIPIIVIDPRKNDTVIALDAEWIPIRPATDSALVDAMAYVIYKEGLADQKFLDECCLGFDENHMPPGVDGKESCLSYLTGEKDGIPKTPEWAEKITGIPAEMIRDLAIRYATAKPAALIQGCGAQRNSCGEQSARGAILLACMTGNVGVSGGYACGAGDCSTHASPVYPIPANPYNRKIPVFLWTEAIERGHEMTEVDGVRTCDQGIFDTPSDVHLDSDIKMIFNIAGNTLVNQHGDINRTISLLKDTSRCEFIVCSDLFMTASAKYADLLLPGTSMFENENITMPWKFTDFLGFNNKVIEPLGECRFEYEWICELACRIGLGEEFSEGRTLEEWLEFLYKELQEKEKELPDYEEFKKAGIYKYIESGYPVPFEKEAKDPVHFPFPTPSGKIELFSTKLWNAPMREYLPPIPAYTAPKEGPEDPLTERYPLQLVGWHTKARTHTVHDNNPALRRLDPQALWMHPEDAKERKIHDGDMVLVWNDRGRIRIPVHITKRIMKGVTALSQGAWYTPGADGTDLGGSINVLTSQHPTPYARGNGQHTNLVEVRACTVR